MNPSFGQIRGAVVLIAVIMAAGALRIADGLFAPILIAFVIGVVLAPLTDRLVRLGLPAPLAALSGLLTTVLMGFLCYLFLQPHIAQLVRRAPIIWSEAQSLMIEVRRFLRGAEQVADSVAKALDTSGGAAADKANGTAEAAAAAIPDVGTAIGYAPTLLGQLLIFTGALFFFLLSRGELYALAARAMPGRVSTERLFAAEKLVSRYFLTIAAINAVLGTLTTVALVALGMPSPILWGGLAFAVNFVPYLGPAIYSVALGIAGILVFDGFVGILPVASFITLNTIEGQFVTPALIGRSMAINPFLVFVTLTAWLWLWGAAGGVVALPLLIWFLALTGWRAGWGPGETPPLPMPATAPPADRG